MNTFIARVWLNDCNNFIISDDQDKHEAAVAGMIARGGRVLEITGCSFELGEVIVQKKDRGGSET